MTLVFPDTTTLLSFAYIGRMDLLRYLANSNGVWCSAVAGESADWRTTAGYEAVSESGSIFGEPLFPTTTEHIEIQMLRATLAGPGDGPRQHLGEAETIVIARTRYPGARFVTDDTDAQSSARAEGLRPLGTGDLLDLAAKVEKINRSTRDGYESTLRRAGRIPARWRT